MTEMALSLTHQPPIMVPRKWQRVAVAKIRQHVLDGGRSYLQVACPGAGKTIAALLAARELIDRGEISRLAIVTPSIALREQWAEKARANGIDVLFYNTFLLEQHRLGLGIPGLVMTYQQIRKPHLLAEWVASAPTAVILDEIHHCAESKMWGDHVKQAFCGARLNLSLRGTPWNESGNPIPFAHYDDGQCVANDTYTYEQALKHEVCRPVEFPLFDGIHEWQFDSEKFSCSFEDEIPEDQEPRRLSAATDAHTDTIERMILAAHARLMEIRSHDGVHARAGALCLGRNEAHVNDLAIEIRKLTGEDPVLIHQNVAGANDLITAFRDSDKCWAVAIKMISEGIDIPRLRVGLYASNIRTPLFFRQFVGRFIRVQARALEERSYVFMPADPELVSHAEQIELEKCHALDLEYQSITRNVDNRTTPLSRFRVLSSAGDHVGTMINSHRIDPRYLEKAAVIRKKNPLGYQYRSDAEIAMTLIDGEGV